MKSLAVFVLLAFPYISFSQNIDFPDPNFKEALIKEGVDSNADGEISIEEAAVVDTLYISGAELSNELRINNLIGINYFTNLIHLDCSSNNLSSLELDGLTSLKHLFCQYNKLTSINFSNLLLLERLFCDHNFLTVLNIEKLPSLSLLHCNNNKIDELIHNGHILYTFLIAVLTICQK